MNVSVFVIATVGAIAGVITLISAFLPEARKEQLVSSVLRLPRLALILLGLVMVGGCLFVGFQAAYGTRGNLVDVASPRDEAPHGGWLFNDGTKLQLGKSSANPPAVVDVSAPSGNAWTKANADAIQHALAAEGWTDPQYWGASTYDTRYIGVKGIYLRCSDPKKYSKDIEKLITAFRRVGVMISEQQVLQTIMGDQPIEIFVAHDPDR
jgi:hypothetical protein